MSTRRPAAPRGSRSAVPRRPTGVAVGRRLVAGRRPGAEPRVTITLRALGLVLVGLVAFIVLAPTLRYAVAQQEDLRELNADLAEARERTARLEEELALWEDPDYVRAQARDRLGYVAPGETPYVVVDPETVVGDEVERTGEEEPAARKLQGPWYLTVLESVRAAGELPADGAPAPEEDLVLPGGTRP